MAGTAVGSEDKSSPPKEPTSPPGRSKTASLQRSKTASPRSPTKSSHDESDEPQIEADDASSDNASTIADNISSYTESVSSSVLDYPTENGRRYHAFRAGAYYAPNDEREIERLDFNHVLMTKIIGGKLFLAPIDAEKVHNVLDIGTGTGIWSIEAADSLPNAKIVGNDLSAIQPTWAPPNVFFEIDDVESPWLYSEKFDFIFCRYMLGAIADWPKLMRSAYENVREGGWVEFQDYDLVHRCDDGTVTDDQENVKWNKGFLKACDIVHREACPGPKLPQWVRDAGFVNVVHHRFKVPVGPWPKDPQLKEIGTLNLVQLLDGMEAFTLRLFCDVLGWTREECLVMLAQVRSEFKSPDIHARFEFHVVYAQKPKIEED